MSDWRKYAVQAHIDNMPVLCLRVDRNYDWRISEHGTPGQKGGHLQHHGRDPITDNVTLLLTVPEIPKLEALADKPGPKIWTHPLLKQISGQIENLAIPAETNLYGYFMATLSFTEGRQPPSQTLDLGTISVSASRSQAAGIYDDLQTDMDGLDDIPTSDGQAFTGAFDDLSGAYNDVDSAFGDMIDGDGTWRDLARELDSLESSAAAFVDAARLVEESVGAASRSIQAAPYLLTNVVREAVDAARQPAVAVAKFVTAGPSDLFSMMADAGIAVSDAAVSALMADNGINDVFYIPPGETITIPMV
jgi:hypothetical protein